jgi:hypothetical protein
LAQSAQVIEVQAEPGRLRSQEGLDRGAWVIGQKGYLDVFYYDESHFNLTPSIPMFGKKKGRRLNCRAQGGSPSM